MSSGTLTTSTLSQLPSISTSGSGGNDGTSRSASYFFGFLVTFAVLLMLFVVAGFVSRHRMRARRHAATIESGIGAGDPWVYGYQQRRMCEETKKIKPVWMERWFEDPVTNEKAKRAGVDSHIGWGDIMPLSATITRVEHEEKVDEGVGEEENIVRRISTSTISSWLSSLSTSKHTDGDMGPSPSHLAIQDATHDPEVGVDVVVMIAMPRSLDTWGYEFGVTNVPIFLTPSSIHGELEGLLSGAPCCYTSRECSKEWSTTVMSQKSRRIVRTLIGFMGGLTSA